MTRHPEGGCCTATTVTGPEREAFSTAVTVTSSPGAINAALAALDEISVFSVSDDFSTSEPTLRTPFTLFGLTDVEVQYWTGTQWLAVPGGTISGNTLVWRRLTFAPIPPTRIRVFVTQALANYTRIVEVEAWGTPVSLPGSIEGTVTSASVAVSGATVEALHGGQAHATTSTSSSGTYALPHLIAGSYDVRVTATNYLPQTQPGVMVTNGVTTTANVDLVPGGGGGGPSGDTVTYYHTDAIGSVRMTTDATGQVIGRYDYLPFGEPWNPPSTPDVRQFTGTARDPETGFDYVGARYYQSQTGRFTRPDTPGLDQNPFDPQSWNLYSYVRNNPLRYIDPTGEKCENGYNAETGAFCTETIGEDPNRRANEAWLMAQQFFFDSFFNRLLTPQVVDFSAGLGDALLLGTGPYLRHQLDIDVVDQCSGAYSAGGWSSFAFGAARLSYAGLAKGASMMAASGAEASAARQSLKTAFRLGIGKNWRAPNLVNKTDAQLRASAGKTNWRVNLYGGGVAAAGGAEGLGIGCGR